MNNSYSKQRSMQSSRKAVGSSKFNFFFILYVLWTAPFGAVLFAAENSDPKPILSKILTEDQWNYWLNLLHYRKGMTGAYKGLTDKDLFYLHPQGKFQPEAEFWANIEAFADETRLLVNPERNLKAHPQCFFPERTRFLQSLNLPQVQFKKLSCPDFEQWAQEIDAKALTLVFSAAYPNSPASLFGHTFLRLGRSVSSSTQALLDYAVSYSAEVREQDLGPVYAYKGIFGGYLGYFHLYPYYMKVNEYNHSESRDLFEYQLNLTPLEVKHLVNHLWELYSSAAFDYYFLDENCASLLASVIHLFRPHWRLTESEYKGYFLPIDIVQRIAKYPGAITAYHYRPALKKQFEAHWDQLDSKAQKQIKSSLKQHAGETFDIKSLDTMLSYYQFRKQQEEGKLTKEEQAHFQSILLKRAGLATTTSTELVKVPSPGGAQTAHLGRKLSLGVMDAFHDQQLLLKTRWAYHQLGERSQGIDDYASFRFADLELHYAREAKKIRVTHFDLIDITSLYPWSFYDPQFAWKVAVGMEPRLDDFANPWSGRGYASAAGGLSIEPMKRWLVYNLLGASAYGSAHQHDWLELRGQWELGSWWMPHADFKLGLQGRAQYAFNQLGDFQARSNLQAELVLNYAWERNWDIKVQSLWIDRLGLEAERFVQRLSLGFFF